MKKSILQKNLNKCYIRNTTFDIHIHHVFYGKNRKNSDEDNCVIALCGRHHNLSNNGIHFNKKIDNEVKEKMQIAWMKHYNKTKEDFIKRYRKNYLS